jgi:hypothetical protein
MNDHPQLQYLTISDGSTFIIPRGTGGGKTSSGMPAVTTTSPKNARDATGAGRNCLRIWRVKIRDFKTELPVTEQQTGDF